MKPIYHIYKIVFVAVLSMFVVDSALAQSQYQPYSYDFYQKLNSDLYSTKSREHTSIKPLIIDSALRSHYDSLMTYGLDGKQHAWLYKKIFNEHLIDYKSSNSTFYGDLLPDVGVGRDLSGKLNTYTRAVGLQLGGTISDNFQYYVAGYLNNAIVPDYLSTYIRQVGIVPGQAYAKTYSDNGYSWSYITAVVSYTPIKYLNISAGRDKTFIGDGYRSMLLSDYASPYPFLKLTGTLGNVRYMVMWADMNDPAFTSAYGADRHKFGVFHYLDWNVNNRLSVGLFENVMGFFTDDNGAKRPFDFNYINPIIFLKPVNNASDDPDKSLLGLTAKYKLTDGITAYGQFALNEFVSKDFFSSDGASVNKYGWQLGIRGANLFGVKNLNYLLESNNAKPYTYSARSSIENYSENSEPLAHLWGANFREIVGLLNYSYKRFDFSAEFDYGHYGLDTVGMNFGKDIFQVYTSPAKFFGNYTGQGLTTNMYYLQGKVTYLLNPKYNLRIELGGIFRQEQNTQFKDRATMLTIGLRSSFRQIYNDLASYRTH
ncbi:gliding motility protein RemB [Mucilaginibacter sp. BT774]|uniref:gliding motility protein RemB n=1 Tax=Mucilaginibacter sp. BT774 TaxID=3062276 RepID=UPI002674E2C7|nr:gliding motility protein RemB [Mucilaginibacter sp. BT774]MDO3626822.1 gliding motility protein RemB [Mucilaginibacter sp. BT774]